MPDGRMTDDSGLRCILPLIVGVLIVEIHDLQK